MALTMGTPACAARAISSIFALTVSMASTMQSYSERLYFGASSTV